jgi:hypothetical protein
MSDKIPALLAAAAFTLLAACSSNSDKNCPTSAALVETSNMTVFPPGASEDPANALYRIAIASVSTDCDIDTKARKADSSLTIHFVATRAPTGQGVSYRVPYFVVVQTGGDIQSKKVLWAHFSFAPGEASASFEEDVDSTMVKVAGDKQPFDYQLLVGLQLTHDQIEYNRKAGHFGP